MATEYRPLTLPGVEDVAEQEAGPHETAVDWTTGEVFPVHPFAARFPLLADDELADLAADIKANGLQVPVVLDGKRQLIDGRNRLLACAEAKREPRYETFTGDDAVVYILALNVHRRHLSEGQRAMAVAWQRLLDSNNPRRLTQQEAAEAAGLKRPRIAYAEVVLRYAPELADAVMHGGRLDDAYDIARERKRQRDADAANLKALKTQQPALAAQVEDGTLSIGEAVAAARAIERTTAEEAEIARLRQAIDLAREEIGNPMPLPANPPDLTTRFVADTEPEYARGNAKADLQAEHAYLMSLTNLVRQVEHVAAQPPLLNVSWADGHLNAVRSAAHGIVAAAYRLVETHEAALGDSARIRKVK